jgi:hypothetical protein
MDDIFRSLSSLVNVSVDAELLPAALGNSLGPLPNEQDVKTFAGCLNLIFRVAGAVGACDDEDVGSAEAVYRPDLMVSRGRVI